MGSQTISYKTKNMIKTTYEFIMMNNQTKMVNFHSHALENYKKNYKFLI